MSNTLRNFIYKTIAATLIVGLGVSKAHAEPVEVKVGYTLAGGLAYWVGINEGYFDEDKVTITMVRMPNASQGPTLLMSGAVDLAFMAVPTAIQAQQGGIDIVLPLAFSRTRNLEYQEQKLIVRQGLEINGPEDLIGKRIGAPGLYGGGHMLFLGWLQRHGISENQVTSVEMPFPNMPDLLRNGTIDAALLNEPLAGDTIEEGIGYSFGNHVGEMNPDIPIAIFGSLRSWADENTEALRAVRDGIRQSVNWINENPQGALDVLGQELGAAAPTVLQIFEEGLSQEDIDFYHELGRDLGIFVEPVDTEALRYEY